MKLDMEAIEKRCEKATPGPWKAYDWPKFPRPDEYGSCVRIENETTITAFCFSGKPNHDALYIAHARTDIPALLEFAKEAKAALGRIATGEDLWHDFEIAREVLAKYFGGEE